jgi:hypothetical protein
MTPPLRLRQVVLITTDLAGVVERLRSELALGEPFPDPGVAEFGLENRVLAAGDCFVEVLTPIDPGSAGARYLARRGGDAGYMAMFQVDDSEVARKRLADLGIRVVWQGDLPDISGTHLHPADIGAAIVSFDWADPPESWHWAGPAWRGGAPAERAGGLTSLTVAALDPAAVARRWADALGPEAELADETTVAITAADQQLHFVAAADRASEGVVGCGLKLPTITEPRTLTIAGVDFSLRVTS